MKMLRITDAMSRSFNRLGLQLQKHSPEILVVVGVVGVVASAVMACKATTKVNDILEDAREQIDGAHEVFESDAASPEPEYSEKDYKKAITIVYAKTGLEFVKLYGPSVALGAASIVSILASNNILRKRNLAMAAAYTAVDTGFKEYRNRVIERFGKELDKELRYNIKAVEVEETVTDENGETQVVKKTVQVADPSAMQYSQYARCFTNGCLGWDKDPEYNLMVLLKQQSHANDLLKHRGYLFLNDVYDMLGIPRSRAGQVVGWIYDEKNSKGDNYIDFGIHNLHDEGCRDFVNGHENSIWLDFNVDGPILDLI